MARSVPVVVAAALMAACASPSASTTVVGNPAEPGGQVTTVDLGDPVFEPGPCPMEPPAGRIVECGTVIVPEDRTRPDGPTVRLAVAILRSGAPARPDPIVYFAGGPGGSSIGELADWASRPYVFLDDRDLVLIDQRGTGWSEPSLACPDVSPNEEPDEVLDCLRDLREEGITLEAYDTAAAAADVADVRVALGYDEWNLFGISYGTRVALLVLRDHPEGVRSAVLDSVYPPEVDAYREEASVAWLAVDATLAACEADLACRSAFPTVRSDLPGLIEDLDRRPVDVDGEAIDGATFLGYLWDVLYDHVGITTVPRAVAAAAAGDLALAQSVLGVDGDDGRRASPRTDGSGSGDGDGAGIGLFYAVECREEVPLGPPADIDDPRLPPQIRDAMAQLTGNVSITCDRAGIGAASDRERQPVSSDLPVLLASGELDPVTPPSWAASAARTLSAAQNVVFPGLGHAVVDGGACPARVIGDFLDDPAAVLDTSCVGDMRVEWDLGE